MANLTLFHEFLVEHAMFPFPETEIGGTVTLTDISELEVGLIHHDWRARYAVPDNNLAKKLCDTLKTILGETPLTESSKPFLLRCFLPGLLVNGYSGRPNGTWLRNPSEAQVSALLVIYTIQVEPLGQSKRLLEFGVFNATRECLEIYGDHRFQALPEQRVEVARSIVDFHVLVNDQLVTLVEAKSPKVMAILGELLPEHSVRMRWTSGSTSLYERVLSKVTVWLPICGLSFNTHPRLPSISV
jgi:hypothetical protein